MQYFCTYFDRNYLLRGITLYRSLSALGLNFKLVILALDDDVFDTVKRMDLKNVCLIHLKSLEDWRPELLCAKKNRGLIEYYFTLTPQLPIFLFEKIKEIDLITYLDADLFFYSSPEPLFKELDEGSILVTPHRYPPHLIRHEQYGIFNVQYQIFRRDNAGLACLNRWASQCLEWCYDRVEADKYGDQKYLDEWPELYKESLVITKNLGAGVAPWNWSGIPIKIKNNVAFVGESPLIFYHFHGVKFFSRFVMSNGLVDWGVMPRCLGRWFYANYFREVKNTKAWIKNKTSIDISISDRFVRGKGINASAFGEIVRKAWRQLTIVL